MSANYRLRELFGSLRKPTSGVILILGFASLGEAIIKWRNWFSSGVLTHYREIRDWIFAWVPFELSANFADYVIIWSSLGFLASWVLLDAERRNNPNNHDHIGLVTIHTVVGFVFGPLVILPIIIPPFSVVKKPKTKVELWEETYPAVEAALEAMEVMRDDLPAQRKALLHATTYLIVGGLALLFAASNLLDAS